MVGESTSSGKVPARCVVRLFVAGDAANSCIAKENLRRLCEQLNHDIEAEVVDVLETPQVAIEHGIYVTPALQIVEPAPGGLIYGNLSDTEAVRRLLF